MSGGLGSCECRTSQRTAYYSEGVERAEWWVAARLLRCFKCCQSTEPGSGSRARRRYRIFRPDVKARSRRWRLKIWACWGAIAPDIGSSRSSRRLCDRLILRASDRSGTFRSCRAAGARPRHACLGQGEGISAGCRRCLTAWLPAPGWRRKAAARTLAADDPIRNRTAAGRIRYQLDLYYLHFPYSPRGVGTWMRAMARAVKAGKIRAVGISNCNVAQMRKAAGVLGRYGIPLAASQVHFSLLHRTGERTRRLLASRRARWSDRVRFVGQWQRWNMLRQSVVWAAGRHQQRPGHRSWIQRARFR
jgi:Aldo/keto reductase family